MKHLRVLLIATIMAALAAGLAYAAARGRPEHARRPGERLARALEMTEEQQAAARPLWEKYHAELRKLRSESLSPAEKRARTREILSRMRDDIAAVLTPAQREKLERLPRPQPGVARQWNARRARGAVRRVAEDLDLTPEQRQKVRDVYRKHREEIRALARDARAAGADRARSRERSLALRETLRDEIRPILTPDQREKMEAKTRRWCELRDRR